MQFSIVSTSEAFWALEDRWSALVERAADSSVFQTFAWQATWWRNFGEGGDLRIILAEDGGDLIGLLPVHIKRAYLLPPVRIRKLLLLGYGGDTAPDDLGPIIASDDPRAVTDTLAAGLQSCRAEWDIAEFDDLHPDCLLVQALKDQGQGDVELVDGARISYVELPASWDAYLAKLSSNRRWKLRRGRKKLFEYTPYRFHVVRSQEELDAHYPCLVRLHHDRWKHRSEHFGFSTDAYVDFHHTVMGQMLKQDSLRLMLLINDDGVMAANYCYRWRGGFYFFQGGFAKSFEPFRIGEVLMGHAIEQAIKEGMSVFDMLRGEHDYKKSLTDKVRTRVHLRLFQPTFRTLSYRALRAGYRRVKNLYAPQSGPHPSRQSISESATSSISHRSRSAREHTIRCERP